MQKLH